MEHNKFKLMVACQKSGITNVEIFDLNRPKGTRFNIAYTKKPERGSNLKVKIGDDGKQAIFSNGIEHYIHDGRSQANFPWIKDKFLRAAVTDPVNEKSFYIACSKDYDRDIDILHSTNQDFNSSVKKFLEPGLFKVYDMKITGDKDKQMINILCRVGDYMNFEIIDVQKAIEVGILKKSGNKEV